ncbi:MAG: PHP domain-containing protein, partial [Planctomycetota bacterium]
LCEASKAAAPKIIETFTSAQDVQRVLASGSTKGSVVLTGDVQADLRVVESKSFGAALSYFTGSKEHNVRLRELAIRKGLKLNEYGLFDGEKQIAGKSESEIYEALDLAFVVPELREDRGEIDAAVAHKLPELIELKDIRGDLHVHTNASDGHNTIGEMIEAAQARGYKYLAICDHSKSQIQANGLDEKRLAGHVEAIRAAAKEYKDIVVLAGCEVDIFKDGSLDFAADVLGELDFVTASAHSALSQGRSDATARTIRAIETPGVHCIGHPSGRLINKRAGMELDIDEIAAAAAANDVALEINAHYWRLDLRDVHVRAAIAAGAKMLINTDAHDISDLDMMLYGVTTARRGWATPADVINTWSSAKLRKWLQRK